MNDAGYTVFEHQPVTRNRILFLFLFLAPLLCGCLGYKEVVLEEIHSVELAKLEAKAVHLRATVRLVNPNGYRIHVLDPDVDLFLNDQFIGKGVLDSTLVLDKRSDRTYSIPMHANLAGGSLLLQLLSGALSGSMKVGAQGTVLGKAGLVRKRFPFVMEEIVDLRGR